MSSFLYNWNPDEVYALVDISLKSLCSPSLVIFACNFFVEESGSLVL